MAGEKGYNGGTGRAHIYTRLDGGSSWSYKQELVLNQLTYEYFGCAVSTQGNKIVIGKKGEGTNFGNAYIFVSIDGLSWTQLQKLEANIGDLGNLYGGAVAIYNDVVVIGAPAANIDQGIQYHNCVL